MTSILFDLTFFCWKQEEKDIKENKLWILFISFQINSILCSIRLFNMAHAIICAQCGQHIIFSEINAIVHYSCEHVEHENVISIIILTT